MATDLLPVPEIDADTAERSDGVRFVRINRAMYRAMVRANCFGPSPRVELLDGKVYRMASMERPHRLVLVRMNDLLVKAMPPGWHVSCQCPIVANDFSEPEPDFAVTRGEDTDYRDRKPTAADTPLLIEVSDSTLAFDRRRKLHVYAEAGIPEYWIVNIPGRTVEIRTDPRPRDGKTRGTYAALREYRGEERIPLRLDGETIAEPMVSELIPL